MGDQGLVRLQAEDWDLLLPGKEYPLGVTKLRITPLGLRDTSLLLKKLADLGELWGPIIDDYSKGTFKDKSPKEVVTEILPKVSEMLASHAVGILSLMSGVVLEDIERLPLKVAIDLGMFCLQMNIESQQGLEKNFKALADLIVTLTKGKKLLGD